MRRFILTGAPGAGKTTLLRYLAKEGCSVAEEAATDVIAREQQKGVPEPWTDPSFIDMILDLQEQRQIQAASSNHSNAQFFDRSPLDTYALCQYLGYPLSPTLRDKIKNIQAAGNYERTVFFIENLGFCEPSEARKISFEESLRFEKIHEDVYTAWGYTCLKIPPHSVPERASILRAHLA